MDTQAESGYLMLQTESGPILLRVLSSEDFSGPQDVADFEYRMSTVLPSACAVSKEIVDEFKKLDVTSLTAEFGVQFVVKSGKLWSALVEAGGECAFKVSLTWTRPEVQDS